MNPNEQGNAGEAQEESSRTIDIVPLNEQWKVAQPSARAATTIPAKHIFLDVVDFTKDRSVEAQTEIVNILNNIVRSNIEFYNIPKEKRIYLPTGDGMCITLLNIWSPDYPYDVHMKIALGIIEGIQKHNNTIEDPMRKFQVRIGINANEDNLISDINSNKNIAGSGINMAARIMSKADGSQILVSQTVYDTLRYREDYMNSFKYYRTTVKHNIILQVYQFIKQVYTGLNTEPPQIFRVAKSIEPKLSKTIAYYFGHAINNRELFISNNMEEFNTSIAVVLCWFLANDSKEFSNHKVFSEPTYMTYKFGEISVEEQYKYYEHTNRTVIFELSNFITREYLKDFDDFFEYGLFTRYDTINEKGEDKLRKEWPLIWDELGLANKAKKI